MAVSGLAAAAVFVLALILGACLTAAVRAKVVAAGLGQTVRDDGPQSHLAKMGTPTLGGLGFLGALALMTGGLALYRGASLSPILPAALLLALAFGAVGFADDHAKLRYRRPLGLKARVRVPIQLLAAALYAAWLIYAGFVRPEARPAQIIPFAGGLPWVAFAMFVIVGGANAVNLTDGLDGLAGGTGVICALGLAGACALLGKPDLALWSLAVAGSVAGFLWLNAPPASIWMGDVGSLGLGAALAAIAVAGGMELLLGLFGIIFVIEALSVIIQVLYFKASGGRRVFRMAPYHHHLELGGLAETKIVVRFWLIGAAAAFVGCGLVAHLVTQVLP